MELSAPFYAKSLNIVHCKSLLPLKEEYKVINGTTYVGLNQALLDAIVNEVDVSRADEAVEDFFYEGLLDDFVKYARRAGYPEDKLKWGIKRALDLGYVMPEKE